MVVSLVCLVEGVPVCQISETCNWLQVPVPTRMPSRFFIGGLWLATLAVLVDFGFSLGTFIFFLLVAVCHLGYAAVWMRRNKKQTALRSGEIGVGPMTIDFADPGPETSPLTTVVNFRSDVSHALYSESNRCHKAEQHVLLTSAHKR